MEMNKEKVIEILISLRNESNKQKIDRYLEIIKNIDESQWEEFLNNNSIKQ